MKFTTITDGVLFKTDKGHLVRKVSGVYNVFQNGLFVGSAGDKAKLGALLRLEYKSQQAANERLVGYLGIVG